MKKIIQIAILLFAPFIVSAQTHLNKVWTTETGNPVANEWQSSITNANNEVITVGNTINGVFGIDILTTKIDLEGNILWQDTFNTASNNNDYGVSVAEDANGNICIIGTTDNGTTNNNNTVMVMYDANGGILWNKIYNSSFSKHDNATALKMDANNNIYVAVASETDFTNYDFILLKYNSSGIFQWQAHYDYDSLIEIPLTIEFDGSNNIALTGASASSVDNWDYTIAIFDNQGNLVNDERISLPGIGFDKPLSFKKDAIGNFYITGTSSANGIDYDIKTIKLSPTYILQWTATMDGATKEDIGNSVDVDAFGNVYVGGYITLANNHKQIILIKYDNNGALLWRHTQCATNAIGDATIKAIKVKNNKEIYFIGQELGNNNTQDAIISKINESGRLLWQKQINTALENKPMSVNIDNDGGVLITTLKNGSISTYETTKYAELDLDTNIVWDAISGNPMYMAHQLIVRFQQEAINKNAIDNIGSNKEIEFGDLQYFLTRNAMDKINDALAPLCNTIGGTSNNPCNIKAVKVFKDMKTTETSMINRRGDVIPIPDLWTTLLLEFPSILDISIVHNIIDTIPSVVRYSEPNRIPISANVNYCNDSSFKDQLSLVYNPIKLTFTGNINVEQAWDIAPEGGKPFVRCGVFDTGLDWKHQDWGYDGADPNSSKIAGGYDYANNSILKNNTQGESDLIESHGTSTAGIIGAQRNNSNNIAGISGGNDSIGSKGISLYSFHVINNGSFVGGIQMSTMYNAIKNSLYAIDNVKQYQLNIQNHSWRYHELSNQVFTENNNNLLTECVHLASRAQTTFVACRGNEGRDNLCYPATIDDDWVLNVGGTGSNGCYSHFDNSVDSSIINSNTSSSFGRNVDIGAPADELMIRTLKVGNATHSYSATSASAPHVSGVVGLLMSYLDSSDASYKNLAPEDCEKIIEISAKDDTCHVGWDKYIGAGLLDAGKALQLVEKPNNSLTHFGTNSKSKSTNSLSYIKVDSNKIVTIKEQYLIYNNYTFAPLKKYKINKYLVTANFNHTLPINHSADVFWARPSSSNLIQDIVNDTLAPRERIKILSCNNTNCTAEGFVYEVFDTNGVFKAWWPCHIDSIKQKATVEYTILSHLAPLNINQIFHNNTDITILPNPSSDVNNISITLSNDAIVRIRLLNLYGQVIKIIKQDNYQQGKIKLQNDISMLSSGIYLYEISINNEKQFFKIIKK